MSHVGDIGPADIANAVAILRRVDDDAAHLVAYHLGDLLATALKAEPDFAARDHAVIEAAALFYPETTSKSRQAALLAAELGRYRGGAAWRQDRFAGSNPHPPGSRKFWLWRILKSADTALSPRRLRAIIR